MHHPILKQLAELKLLFKGYPDFVYSNNRNDNLNGIPVFVYHTINPELFESHLLYLKENNYRTLSIDEFYESITGKNIHEKTKSVLLTIDDARLSVWKFAYPLLKKYDIKTVVFIIPGLTADNEPVRKNLDDVWNGKVNFEEIRDIDFKDYNLCNWNELSEMYSSGLINIESHTLFHREIFNNNNVKDFVTGDKPFYPYNFTGSPYLPYFKIKERLKPENYFGLPLFNSAPLMLAGPKLNLTPEFISKCKEIYNQSAKSLKNNWKQGIRDFINASSKDEKYFYIEDHSKADVMKDLSNAREIIWNKLGRNAGNHLCLPWNIGNEETISIIKELDIKSCFWGVLPGKKINKAGDDIYFVSRIKNDFVFRLPGKGRKKLISIYKYKLKRRFSKEPVF